MNRQGSYAGTTYRAASLFVHENFVGAENGNDIAIIRLTYSVDLSDAVNVICLPNAKFAVPMYSPVVITGFGLTSEGGDLPNTLQQAIIQVLPTCGNAYPSFNSGNQICAGLSGGGKDTCQGDSGGPVVFQPHRSEQWFLVGITSYGNGCARINYPGIYTKVSSFAYWIRRIVASQ